MMLRASSQSRTSPKLPTLFELHLGKGRPLASFTTKQHPAPGRAAGSGAHNSWVFRWEKSETLFDKARHKGDGWGRLWLRFAMDAHLLKDATRTSVGEFD